jgi:hypothetical protein
MMVSYPTLPGKSPLEFFLGFVIHAWGYLFVENFSGFLFCLRQLAAYPLR